MAFHRHPHTWLSEPQALCCHFFLIKFKLPCSSTSPVLRSHGEWLCWISGGAGGRVGPRDRSPLSLCCEGGWAESEGRVRWRLGHLPGGLCAELGKRPIVFSPLCAQEYLLLFMDFLKRVSKSITPEG